MARICANTRRSPGAGAVGASALILCATFATAEYQGAPAWEWLAKEGKLPSTVQRLPEAPFVETLVNGVGKYGGTIGSPGLGGDRYNPARSIGKSRRLDFTDCQPIDNAFLDSFTRFRADR